jgi:WhiB family transcriptional regulator, redox-sensing transcriptional regulator
LTDSGWELRHGEDRQIAMEKRSASQRAKRAETNFAQGEVMNQNITPDMLVDEDSATGWMALGACRAYPPNMFFPSDGVGVDRARKICATCQVSSPCLEYALENHVDHGVWGGCSERERRRISKRRRIGIRSI